MMNSTVIILLAVVVIAVVMNIVTFALYAMDKSRAQKNQWRIKEATLITCGFLMGGLGAFLGMKILRHKTQHTMFKILVPLAMLLNGGVIVLALFLLYS